MKIPKVINPIEARHISALLKFRAVVGGKKNTPLIGGAFVEAMATLQSVYLRGMNGKELVLALAAELGVDEDKLYKQLEGYIAQSIKHKDDSAYWNLVASKVTYPTPYEFFDYVIRVYYSELGFIIISCR